jgi:hypothetical protein
MHRPLVAIIARRVTAGKDGSGPLARFGHIADGAWHTGFAASAGIRMIVPGSIGVHFTNPTRAMAGWAAHWWGNAIRRLRSCGFMANSLTATSTARSLSGASTRPTNAAGEDLSRTICQVRICCCGFFFGRGITLPQRNNTGVKIGVGTCCVHAVSVGAARFRPDVRLPCGPLCFAFSLDDDASQLFTGGPIRIDPAALCFLGQLTKDPRVANHSTKKDDRLTPVPQT